MATDILMRVKKDGNFLGVPGETQATIDKQDELTKDFTPGKFIEIKSFSFGVSLVDKDTSPEVIAMANRGENDGGYDGKFKNFIQGLSVKAGPGQTIYPVSFDEVAIEGQINSSSPILMQSCFSTKTLNQVTIVKRKTAGVGSAIGNIPYLRVDFDDVLITDLSWKLDDHTVSEDFKFVYRTITLKYRPQNNDGTPGVVVNVGPLSLVQTKSGGK